MIESACAVAAAALLAVAGLAKLRTPGPAAAMIVGLWPRLRPLRRARAIARTAGVVEIGVGVATLAVGNRAALSLLVACYLVLTVLAVRLARGAQQVACGCFGAADAPVGAAHVVVDLACLGVACWAFVEASSGVSGLYERGIGVGLVGTAQALLLAALGYLCITALPALSAARRSVGGT